jgi:hypothetical protein
MINQVLAAVHPYWGAAPFLIYVLAAYGLGAWWLAHLPSQVCPACGQEHPSARPDEICRHCSELGIQDDHLDDDDHGPSKPSAVPPIACPVPV